MVDKLLDGLKDWSGGYIDDLVIFTVTWKEHLRWEAVKPGLDWTLDSGLDSGLDYGLDSEFRGVTRGHYF
jgi:hypothetical protein